MITGTMEMENEAAFVGSACGVATIFNIAGDGGIAAAVYTPDCVIDPHAFAVHPLPAMLQEMARSGFEFVAGVMVAAYVAVVPASTESGPPMERENVLVRVKVTEADLEESAALSASKVMLGGEGIIPGAV